MKIYIHKREKHDMTDILFRHLSHVGLHCQYVNHLLDISPLDEEKQILLINWPHLFYHNPLATPHLFPSLRRWYGFKLRLWQLRRRGVESVWIVHNLHPHNRKLPGLDNRVRHFLIERCSGIIPFCEESYLTLVRIAGTQPKHHAIVPYAPLRPLPWILQNRQAARWELGIKASDRVLINFGMWRHYKGLEELIPAFKKLLGVNLQLIMLGQPTEELSEVDIISLKGEDDRIRLIPRKYGEEELSIWLTAADWAVLPYRDITNSGAAMTALNWGCPVIAPRMGCLPKIVTQGTGILYNPGELLEALQRAIMMNDCEIVEYHQKAQDSFSESDLVQTALAIKTALESFFK